MVTMKTLQSTELFAFDSTQCDVVNNNKKK